VETNESYDVYNSRCPTRAALDRIAGKWAILILGLLEEGPRRFSDLQRRIDGVSQKMLTQTLRGLERDGLISRTVYPVVPPKVEYRLTALGDTLSKPIAAIKCWSETYIQEIISAQERYDQQASQTQ
jgi:DNA-binding HxlR family transcriptional regulator